MNIFHLVTLQINFKWIQEKSKHRSYLFLAKALVRVKRGFDFVESRRGESKLHFLGNRMGHYFEVHYSSSSRTSGQLSIQ